MIKEAAVFGSGGHARVIASILRILCQPILGFFDDSYSGNNEIIQGKPLIGNFQDILKYKDRIGSVFIALGNNLERRKSFHFLKAHGFELPFLIHPQALINTDVSIEEASVICMGAKLCTEVRIGKGCILNTGCSVDHESVVGDFVHIAPQTVVAGRSTIGNQTFIGMNACIADKIRVGNNVIIGAGSVVLHNVPDGKKVFGVYH